MGAVSAASRRPSMRGEGDLGKERCRRADASSPATAQACWVSETSQMGPPAPRNSAQKRYCYARSVGSSRPSGHIFATFHAYAVTSHATQRCSTFKDADLGRFGAQLTSTGLYHEGGGRRRRRRICPVGTRRVVRRVARDAWTESSNRGPSVVDILASIKPDARRAQKRLDNEHNSTSRT